MKVAFEPGLESLARDLGHMGYDMSPLGSDVGVDAVLYAASAGGALRQRSGDRGAVVICAKGMDARSASLALGRRSAQQLF